MATNYLKEGSIPTKGMMEKVKSEREKLTLRDQWTGKFTSFKEYKPFSKNSEIRTKF